MVCCPHLPSSTASVPKLGYAYPQGYAKWFRGYAGRKQKTDGIRRMYRLKQNCNFQTETPFCALKSPKFPCILSCKTIFLSYKHNNGRNAPLFNTDLRSLSNEFAHLPNRLQIMFFLVFCSVDGWQTTTLEGLGHLWHILFTHFKPSIYLMVNKMSRIERKKTEFTKCETENAFFFNRKSLALCH